MNIYNWYGGYKGAGMYYNVPIADIDDLVCINNLNEYEASDHPRFLVTLGIGYLLKKHRFL